MGKHTITRWPYWKLWARQHTFLACSHSLAQINKIREGEAVFEWIDPMIITCNVEYRLMSQCISHNIFGRVWIVRTQWTEPTEHNTKIFYTQSVQKPPNSVAEETFKRRFTMLISHYHTLSLAFSTENHTHTNWQQQHKKNMNRNNLESTHTKKLKRMNTIEILHTLCNPCVLYHIYIYVCVCLQVINIWYGRSCKMNSDFKQEMEKKNEQKNVEREWKKNYANQ